MKKLVGGGNIFGRRPEDSVRYKAWMKPTEVMYVSMMSNGFRTLVPAWCLGL